jgi:hypothetical protein
MFACRADVDLLAPRHRIVVSEGIIDLIGIETAFYPEERWEPHFAGIANCGSTHASSLRMALGVGLIQADVDLYPDAEPGWLEKLKHPERGIRAQSPFFRSPGYTFQAYYNAEPGEKDFGVPREKMKRTKARM